MRRKNVWTSLLSIFIMTILLLDWNTALNGAKEGIRLCLQSVIPSLFPMFVLTTLISSSFCEKSSKFSRFICKLCKMPVGAESFLFLGLLSGYPIGAQCIADAYSNKQLEKDTARRLLGFCSNAGPSFILGMASSLFSSKFIPFMLWFVHILSALIVGHLLPRANQKEHHPTPRQTITISKAVEKSVKSIALVCGWIVLFRIIIAIINKWLFASPNNFCSVIISGILELANGIHLLNAINNLGMRFAIASFNLGFGGLCILLQTNSVTGQLGLGYYFPGKVLHGAISFLLSSVFQNIIFPKEHRWDLIWFADIFMLIICISIIYFLYKQKNSSISGKYIV